MRCNVKAIEMSLTLFQVIWNIVRLRLKYQLNLSVVAKISNKVRLCNANQSNPKSAIRMYVCMDMVSVWIVCMRDRFNMNVSHEQRHRWPSLSHQWHSTTIWLFEFDQLKLATAYFAEWWALHWICWCKILSTLAMHWNVQLSINANQIESIQISINAKYNIKQRQKQ